MLPARGPHLLVLDLMRPGPDGLEVCRQLRGDRDTARVPITLLIAKAEEIDLALIGDSRRC